MAKVLILASFPDSLICFRRELLVAMVKAGHDVFACAPAASAEVREQVEELGVRYLDVPLDRTGTSLFGDFRYLAAVIRRCRDIQPDLIFSYTIKPVIYGSIAAYIARVPFISSMITGLGYVFSGETLKQRVLRRIVLSLYRTALRMNRAAFFQNPDDIELFRSSGLLPRGQEPVLINGSGIDLIHFAPRPFPNGTAFLLIARLLREKGVREYVEAARVLKAKYPEVQFRLAGWIDDNPSAIGQQELEGWVREGTIEYLGLLKDIRPAMASASVYVLPSYREGTPRTVLEALAMGRPVVTTDAPGCRETVEYGENGFLVPVKDVSALAAALDRFILDPELAPSMGKASRRIAEEKYDVHDVNRVILRNLGLFPAGEDVHGLVSQPSRG